MHQQEGPLEKSSKENQSTPWFSTTELLEYLGISDSELKEQTALLTEGIHFKRANPSDPTSQMLWQVDLIDQLLCLPIPPLEKEAMLNAINNKITCQE